MSFHNNAIFWVEVEKVHPNPFQPRRDFDEEALRGLADSIRQYGVLQPLTVTRKEVAKEDGGLAVEYELIAGERRLRASKLAGIAQVPVTIRDSEDDDRVKLEIAIIENLQREDLNVIDRARAFQRLVSDFGFKHGEVGKKVGKSREYVSNTLRLLALPEDMLAALGEGKINEGHTRPLLMLIDRPQEQQTLFKEIMARRMNVREAEQISRRIAYEKVRRSSTTYSPDLVALEEQLSEHIGARVRIESKEGAGRIFIDFDSPDILNKVLMLLKKERDAVSAAIAEVEDVAATTPRVTQDSGEAEDIEASVSPPSSEDDLYSVGNFSL